MLGADTAQQVRLSVTLYVQRLLFWTLPSRVSRLSSLVALGALVSRRSPLSRSHHPNLTEPTPP